MFSYRHAFHAGNHADVLKHLVLVQILQYFNQKDSPYWVVDTHAGGGAYALEAGAPASSGLASAPHETGKRPEYLDGIARLWDQQALPPAVDEYLALVKDFNADARLRHYPGSPWLAASLIRDQDRLRWFELHPSEVQVLRRNAGQLSRSLQKRLMIDEKDGFDGVKAVLPPPTRRGIVLMDPSYEDKRDYRRTVTALKEGLKRFATGCYVIWYPQLSRPESRQLPDQLVQATGERDWLHVSLTVRAPSADGLGLHGSGMFVVNPPWTLAGSLSDAMPALTGVLAQDDRASFSLKTSG